MHQHGNALKVIEHLLKKASWPPACSTKVPSSTSPAPGSWWHHQAV